MRPYRGKRIDNGEWIYGCYWLHNGHHHIITSVKDEDSTLFDFEVIEVDPETVGQLVFGKCHTGDIFTVVCDCDSEYGCSHPSENWELIWHEQYCQYGYRRGDRFVLLDEFGDENIHLIGNIHDHPHLLYSTS